MLYREYLIVRPCTVRLTSISCFLAVKHASAAMKQANEARGKPFGGGSIILTASGLFFFSNFPEHQVYQSLLS